MHVGIYGNVVFYKFGLVFWQSSNKVYLCNTYDSTLSQSLLSKDLLFTCYIIILMYGYMGRSSSIYIKSILSLGYDSNQVMTLLEFMEKTQSSLESLAAC